MRLDCDATTSPSGETTQGPSHVMGTVSSHVMGTKSFRLSASLRPSEEHVRLDAEHQVFACALLEDGSPGRL